MKNSILKIFVLSFLIFLIGQSCNQDELLEEVPKDFYAPENSYVTPGDFHQAVTQLYYRIREIYKVTDAAGEYNFLGQGLDIAVRTNGGSSTVTETINWSTLTPDNGYVLRWWREYYSWIFIANTIIDRSEGEQAEWTSEEEKNAIVGEAKFIRAFAYRLLANMWGDVPLVLNETQGAIFDYERAPKEQVLQQCVEDLEFCTQWMKTVDQLKPGQAPRAAAYHILAEVQIALGNYQEAIDATIAVTEDPNYHLMTERFGSFKDWEWWGYDRSGPKEPWGDVFWDLSREGNMNWQDGNKEAIFNMQMDFNIDGGGKDTYAGGNFNLVRWWSPLYYNWYDNTGVRNLFRDTLQNGGVGHIFGTDYALTQVWNYKDDWDRDIRNSKYNIQREFYFNNVASPYYLQPVTADKLQDPNQIYTVATPVHKKASPTYAYGIAVREVDQPHDYGRIFKDWPIIRLSETYLLQAEAYHLLGNNSEAANSINVIRNRAQATPVTAADVNMDLILDERVRELYQEEWRLHTLLRTGKFAEYLRKYNEGVKQLGHSISDHINLLPIPTREIESNKENELRQNPGY